MHLKVFYLKLILFHPSDPNSHRWLRCTTWAAGTHLLILFNSEGMLFACSKTQSKVSEVKRVIHFKQPLLIQTFMTTRMYRILKTRNKTRRRLFSFISLHGSESCSNSGIGRHASNVELSLAQTQTVQISDPTEVQTYPTGCLCKACSVKYCYRFCVLQCQQLIWKTPMLQFPTLSSSTLNIHYLSHSTKKFSLNSAKLIILLTLRILPSTSYCSYLIVLCFCSS